MRKIKIAQIGTGHDHASAIVQVLRSLPEIFEVVGYADVPEDDNGDPWQSGHAVNSAPAYDGVKKYTVDEILRMPDLDAVAIETFDLNLVQYAQAAADRGLHIHMDKAPGESAESFEKLLSTIKAKNLAFSIGYMYRQNPLLRQAFSRVEKGELGSIHSVEAEMSCFYEKDKREWLKMLQGGMMQYLGCHLVDFVVRLLGVPERILPLNKATGYQSAQSLDLGLAVFEYPNGVTTIKSCMGDHGGFMRRHIVINGEKGTIELRPIERFEKGLHAISTQSVFYNKPSFGDAGEITDSEVFSRYENMLRAFAETVRGERGMEVDLETEARIHRCLLTACGLPCDYKCEINL